jgi:hypothetical protein
VTARRRRRFGHGEPARRRRARGSRARGAAGAARHRDGPGARRLGELVVVRPACIHAATGIFEPTLRLSPCSDSAHVAAEPILADIDAIGC